MRACELWRYPVKSLQGERLQTVNIAEEGVEGDRRYAIFDVDTGFGLTARRLPELLFGSARLSDTGQVTIVLRDGAVVASDDDLSDWLGRRVVLRSADNLVGRRYEDVVDFEEESSSAWKPFEGAQGPFHDRPRARVSIVSTATLGSWDRRRFRSNLVLDGEGEDALVGRRVTLGEVTLEVAERLGRCVIVTRAQPGRIERDLSVLRKIAQARDGCLGVGALVSRPGTVSVGDTLVVDGQPSSAR